MKLRQLSRTTPNTTLRLSKFSWALVVGALIILMLISALAFRYFQTRPTNQGGPNQMTVSGMLVCLPPKSNQVHSLECVVGLKSDSGDYYALKDDHERLSNLPIDTHLEVSGTLQRGDNEKYQIKGTVLVDSIKDQRLEL